MSENDELVKEFLIESYEGLDRLDRHLVELEQDPGNAEILASVFRTIHTIKGTCGFIGFSKLESISHIGENLLSRMRDGEIRLDAEITTGLLAMVDAIRSILASIESVGHEGATDYTALIADLKRLNEPRAVAADARPQEPAPASAPAAAVAVEATPVAATPVVATPVAAPSPVVVTAAPPVPPAAAPAASTPPRASAPVDMHDEEKRVGEERRGGDERRQPITDSSLRVDVGLIDRLMNLVGELVLARNQILQFTTTQRDTSFVGATQRLNLVTSELQEGVMKTRMQPIGNIWSKFPRVVRDLATQCGKQVRIEMEGKETDLDKTIIEAIKDPLTHIIRNSVDHGIEDPAVRVSRGKPAEGFIRLRAFHEGGQINIEISDDGGGINPEKVRAKAVQRGLITTDQASRLVDHEVIRLIFAAGFSTAEQITNVSGRGVGMDVVKTNIEKIGGTVDIQSKVGEGTTLKIKIPLTLAIIPALMVSSRSERFAIPQVSLLELVRLEGDNARKGLERIHNAVFYRLRGNLLPLVHLDKELKLGAPAELNAADGDDAINIVVLKADDRQFGLIVGAINDTEEIVVKPLGRQLKGIGQFAGATIMGDGRVALILDVMGLAQRAGVVTEQRSRSLSQNDQSGPAADDDALRTLMLFRVSAKDRMAIPLAMVARLEEFPGTSIEYSGGQEVVQYRGEILPLISLAQYFGASSVPQGDPRQVVVFSQDGRSVGLVVEQILDIVNETVTVQRRTRRRGVLGSAVIQGRVTELLDVQAVIKDFVVTSADGVAA